MAASDDPKGGWKARGLWVTSGNRTPVHIEGIDAPPPGAPARRRRRLSSPLVVNFPAPPESARALSETLLHQTKRRPIGSTPSR